MKKRLSPLGSKKTKIEVSSSFNRAERGNREDILDNISELKQLEKVLGSLINAGNEYLASKYLDGFLEDKDVKSLNDYLEKLNNH